LKPSCCSAAHYPPLNDAEIVVRAAGDKQAEGNGDAD
jgi:hypothetical protein